MREKKETLPRGSTNIYTFHWLSALSAETNQRFPPSRITEIRRSLNGFYTPAASYLPKTNFDLFKKKKKKNTFTGYNSKSHLGL